MNNKQNIEQLDTAQQLIDQQSTWMKGIVDLSLTDSRAALIKGLTLIRAQELARVGMYNTMLMRIREKNTPAVSAGEERTLSALHRAQKSYVMLSEALLKLEATEEKGHEE